MTSLSLDLFTPSPCLCGWPADVDEDEGEVRIGGWCMCPMKTMPVAVGKTMAEARERWEEEIAGFASLADASRPGGNHVSR